MLAIFFFIIALFYASIGFGGGSSYIALLVLWQTPYYLIPIIGLVCNMVVVSGNSFHYARSGHFNAKLFTPLMITSVPFAYIGGRLPVSKDVFTFILCVVLLVSGLRLLLKNSQYDSQASNYQTPAYAISLLIGAVLGFVAGITGIGGGIFLAPMLYNLRAATPKVIATTASLFILINSVAGLLGQLHKSAIAINFSDYWLLPLAVLLGGQLGNQIMLRFLSARATATMTALLVLFVATNLGVQNWRAWLA